MNDIKKPTKPKPKKEELKVHRQGNKLLFEAFAYLNKNQRLLAMFLLKVVVSNVKFQITGQENQNAKLVMSNIKIFNFSKLKKLHGLKVRNRSELDYVLEILKTKLKVYNWKTTDPNWTSAPGKQSTIPKFNAFVYFDYFLEGSEGKQQLFIKCKFEPLITNFFGELVKRNFDIADFELLKRLSAQQVNKYSFNLWYLINSIYRPDTTNYKINIKRLNQFAIGDKKITPQGQKQLIHTIKTKAKTDYNKIIKEHNPKKGIYLEKIERMDDEYIELFLIRFMDLLNNK